MQNEKDYTKLDDSKERLNNHGMVVGTKGTTGLHSHGGVYKGSSIIPRPNGGVLVIVSSFYIPHEEDGDELRFHSRDDAIEYLDDLTRKSQDEIDKMPF